MTTWAAMLRTTLASSRQSLRRLVPRLRGRRAPSLEPQTSAPNDAPPPAAIAAETTPPNASGDAPPSGGLSRRLIAFLVGGALLGKVLGFAREILMAQVLGASLVADGLRGALTAAFLPLVFLQNESAMAILIPIQREAQKSGDAPRRLCALAAALTLVAFGIMLIVQALGSWWVESVVGGFVPEGLALTLEFLRIIALAMPASTLLACLSAGEIAVGQASITNLRASLQNICVMLGIGLFLLTGNVALLAWSFAFALNGLALLGLATLWRQGHFSFAGARPAMIRDAGMEFFGRLRVLLALPFIEQANTWLERLLASRLTTGAVASLDYARTLTDSAFLLISHPVGLGVLSSHPPRDEQAWIEMTASRVLAVALPASVFLGVFAPDIVRLLFFRGAFTETGLVLTSQALRGIAVGLWASTLGWIILRTLNRAGRNARVAVILVSAYAANLAVNAATSNLDTSGMGLLLIGLGESARSLILLAGAVFALQCRRRLFVLILKATPAAAMAAILCWQVQQAFANPWERLLAGGLVCALSVGLAAVLLMPVLAHFEPRLLCARLFANKRP